MAGIDLDGFDLAGFDLDGPWRIAAQVAVRPERFGALLYHFGTRRLSFLKDPVLLEVVRGLAGHDSARSACLAAGVGPGELPSFAGALATLARTDMLVPADPPADPPAGPPAGRVPQQAGAGA